MLGSQMNVNNTVRASSIYFRGVLLLFVPFVENRFIAYVLDRLIA